MKDNDKQPYLYHFMPIHKFIDFALNKALKFTSLTYMEDKLDGISIIDANILPSCNLQQSLFDQNNFLKLISLIRPEVKIAFNNANRFRNHSLSCCFYYPTKSEESIAMWKLYSKEDSVALKIPKQDLESFIKKGNFEHYSICNNGDNGSGHNKPIFFQGKVEYLDFFSVKANESIQQGFLKHIDYSYENEYRILMVNNEEDIKQWEEKTDEDLKKLRNASNDKIDPSQKYHNLERKLLNDYKYIAYTLNPKHYKIELSSDLLTKTSIVSSPFIDLWKLNNLKSIIKKLDFNIDFQYSHSLPKLVVNSLNLNA